MAILSLPRLVPQCNLLDATIASHALLVHAPWRSKTFSHHLFQQRQEKRGYEQCQQRKLPLYLHMLKHWQPLLLLISSDPLWLDHPRRTPQVLCGVHRLPLPCLNSALFACVSGSGILLLIPIRATELIARLLQVFSVLKPTMNAYEMHSNSPNKPTCNTF